MIRMPKIKSVMTAFPYSVTADTTASDAIALMESHNIRHLPVMRNDIVVGIVSDRDIKLLLHTSTRAGDQNLQVGDAPLTDPYIVDLQERLDMVLTYMADNHIYTAIVTRNDRLAGLFTSTDAYHAFAEFLRDQFRRSGGGDAA